MDKRIRVRQRWLWRLLTCCSVTPGGAGLEGMWGEALQATNTRRKTSSAKTAGSPR